MTRKLRISSVTFFAVSCLLCSCGGQNPQPTQPVQTISPKIMDTAAAHLYGMPTVVNSIDTSPAWKLPGRKLLVTGIVYKPDGTSPAPDVLVYYYQTNTSGEYLNDANEPRSLPPNSQGQTHGYIRGWVRSDSNGRYSIYTIRPGSYPNSDNPAHIHVTIDEPGPRAAYYIDEIVFDDDKLLKSAYRKKMENRAGSGVLRLVKKDGLEIGERNIYLGLNIPNYSAEKAAAMSGKNPGEDLMSFIPYHAWGPDKGTRTCPVCKYGWYHGIMYFVGNNPDWADIESWLVMLEAESKKREKFLKVYFIYGNTSNYNKQARMDELGKLGQKLKLEKLALTFVPSFTDEESEVNLARIDGNKRNTFLIYKRGRIVARFIDLPASNENMLVISKSLDQSKDEYFEKEAGDVGHP